MVFYDRMNTAGELEMIFNETGADICYDLCDLERKPQSA